MQGNNKFVVPIHIHATLAANAEGSFTLPFGCTLQEIQFGNSVAASDAILVVGTAADPNGIIEGGLIGDSSALLIYDGKDNGDMDGDLFTGVDEIDYIHLAKSTVVEWAIDFDGVGGTAAAHLDLIFVFEEG